MKRKIILSLFAFLISLSFSFESGANPYKAFYNTLSLEEKMHVTKSSEILLLASLIDAKALMPYGSNEQIQSLGYLLFLETYAKFMRKLAKQKGYTGLEKATPILHTK